MLPPLVRRCPACGHMNWSHRFRVVDTATGRHRVACPVCAFEFETVDNPRLN